MILDVFLDASLFPCMRLFHVVWVWVGVVGEVTLFPHRMHPTSRK